MTSPWREVTAWPFVVPLAVMAGVVLLWRLHRRSAELVKSSVYGVRSFRLVDVG